jgi:hypothetical protein
LSERLRQRLRPAPDVVFREVEGEMVLLDLAAGRYFGLDEVGTRMWQVLTEADTLEAACEQLVGEFEVEPERLREDLLGLVEELRESGLLVSGESSEASTR